MKGSLQGIQEFVIFSEREEPVFEGFTSTMSSSEIEEVFSGSIYESEIEKI